MNTFKPGDVVRSKDSHSGLESTPCVIHRGDDVYGYQVYYVSLDGHGSFWNASGSAEFIRVTE